MNGESTMLVLVPPSSANRICAASTGLPRWCCRARAIVGEVIHVRVGAIDLARGIDDETLQARIVGALAVVVQVAALNRVVVGDGAGQLDLTALVEVVRDQADAGLREVNGASVFW